jgi:hypothetical protein
LSISSTVDVAESAVTHLLDQVPSLQSRVSGKLALGLTLLSNDALEHFGVDILSLLFLLLLLVNCGTGGSTGLSSNVTVVESSSREVALSGVCLQRLVSVDVGITHGILVVMPLLVLPW